MLRVLRNFAALLVGMLVGSLLNMGVVMVNLSLLFPVPEGFDFNDVQQMAAYTQTLPALAFVVTIVAHSLQAFVGGWVAARLGASRPLVLAGAIGAITVAASIYNLAWLPAPDWMWVEVPLLVVLSWRAGLMEQTRRAALEVARPEAGSDAGHSHSHDHDHSH